jgi:hypothetical protein
MVSKPWPIPVPTAPIVGHNIARTQFMLTPAAVAWAADMIRARASIQSIAGAIGVPRSALTSRQHRGILPRYTNPHRVPNGHRVGIWHGY